MKRLTCWIKGHIWNGAECMRCDAIDVKSLKKWIRREI